MGGTQPFTGTFPFGIDPAIVLAAGYALDKNDRRRIDSQIRSVQQFLLTGTPITISGNTTLSAGQLTTRSLFLSGSPGGAFTVTLPTVAGTASTFLVLNGTAQTATFAAATGGTNVALPSTGLGWIAFDGANLYILVTGSGGGGGGSGGPTLLATLYATPGSPIARAAAWMRQPYDTLSGAGGFTAPTTQTVGDQIDALDAGRSWGTAGKLFTFNGGGTHLVEDPFNQSKALAAAWTSPVGFNESSVAWQLITDTNIGTYWKSL